jgi:hypothetical protein
MANFKKGDKVVLIDDDDLDIRGVELYGVYTVDGYVDNLPFSPLIILKETSAVFAGERFVSIINFRKQKINKIISKCG